MPRKDRQLKNGKSYGKVIELLRETTEYTQVVNIATMRLSTFSIDKAEYIVDWNGKPRCEVRIRLGEGENSVTKGLGTFDPNSNPSDWHITLTMKDVIREFDCKSVVNANFGKVKEGYRKVSVPTYNCSPERVLSMLEKDFEKLRWNEDTGEYGPFSGMLIDGRQRITDLMAGFVKSDAFQEGCKNAREDHIVNKIKGVLLQFPDATPEVLKRALNEYVMHEICDV